MGTREKLRELEQQIALIEGLPHLFAIKPYEWQKKFLESDNRDCFVCAANQIGKSSAQIIKAITWATDSTSWDKYWKRKPNAFWYLYPSLRLATDEFHEKWMKEFLPRNGFENHPQYGYKINKMQKLIHSIDFNTGVTIYFKSYSQNEADLQAGTISAIFCDEELPYNLYGELQARLRNTRGYFSMVFTATLGQDIWRCAMEEKGKLESFRNAFKQQISMYDCMEFADGSLSQWTEERISEEINRCGTETEVQRRIFGKFVVEGGLVYPSFIRKENVVPKHKIPRSWHVFSGIDIGSGGEHGHPSAITLIAVSPDYQRGRVIEVWRGDGIETTSSDVIKQYKRMKNKLGRPVVNAYYDWAAKDFEIIATRAGEPMIKAEKSHDIGEGILNTLFKNKMLKIYDSEDAKKLINELVSLKVTTRKTIAKDDAIDSLRYACASIPWDFSVINGKTRVRTGERKLLPDEREVFRAKQLAGLKPEQDVKEQVDAIASELSEANDFYDN